MLACSNRHQSVTVFFSNCIKSDQEFDREFYLTLLASHSKPQNNSSQELDLGLVLTKKDRAVLSDSADRT